MQRTQILLNRQITGMSTMSGKQWADVTTDTGNCVIARGMDEIPPSWLAQDHRAPVLPSCLNQHASQVKPKRALFDS